MPSSEDADVFNCELAGVAASVDTVWTVHLGRGSCDPRVGHGVDGPPGTRELRAECGHGMDGPPVRRELRAERGHGLPGTQEL